jgi:hypothetical protein
MNVGMLWFDNDPRTALTAKVRRAADYYRQKYGLVADMCLVHPSMLAGTHIDLVEGKAGKVAGMSAEASSGSVSVHPTRLIQPGHLWIGKEDQN